LGLKLGEIVVHNRYKPSRFGLTLIEVLVVIAVIGVLMSALLPAISSSRETSRLVTCMNNLRQLSMGMMEAERTQRIVPHNGGVNPGATILATPGDEFIGRDGQPYRLSITMGGAYWPLGLGNPKSLPQSQGGSWCYSVLPYVGEKVAYDAIRFQDPQPLYLCPTRARAATPKVPVNDLIFSCVSGDWPWAKTDYAATRNIGYKNHGQMLSRFERYGLDNTILLGEKAMNLQQQLSTSWLYDEPLFAGGSKSGTTRSLSHLLTKDGPDANYENSFGAAHSSGVNFAFFTTRTQTISYAIDETVAAELDPTIELERAGF
jgi:prepilin-type N-terminal cleavage/methylation domain-containing protein